MDDSEITDTCCLDEPQDRPVPLIVTMEDATDPQDVSGISPIPLSRSKIRNYKLISNMVIYVSK